MFLIEKTGVGIADTLFLCLPGHDPAVSINLGYKGL